MPTCTYSSRQASRYIMTLLVIVIVEVSKYISTKHLVAASMAVHRYSAIVRRMNTYQHSSHLYLSTGIPLNRPSLPGECRKKCQGCISIYVALPVWHKVAHKQLLESRIIGNTNIIVFLWTFKIIKTRFYKTPLQAADKG